MTAIIISLLAFGLICAIVYAMANPKIRVHAVDNWRQGLKFLSLWPVAAAVVLQGIDIVSTSDPVLQGLPGLEGITHSTTYHAIVMWLGAIGMALRFLKQTHAASPAIVGPLPDVEKP